MDKLALQDKYYEMKLWQDQHADNFLLALSGNYAECNSYQVIVDKFNRLIAVWGDDSSPRLISWANEVISWAAEEAKEWAAKGW